MRNEYRVVPVELLKRCIQNNDEPQPSQLYADIMGILDTPVPPAGGEVLVKILSENNGVLSVKMEVGSFTEGLELVDRAHVARLQAEVQRVDTAWHSMKIELDSTKSELTSLRKALADTESDVETIAEHNIELQSELTDGRADTVKRLEWVKEASARIDILESELSKARECLKDVGVEWESVADIYQSTPAAKDGE